MIQTNYPLSNINNIPFDTIALNMHTSSTQSIELPGCDTHSVGFHSDEGCGYCPNTGQIFFTMNGKNLGIAYTSLFYNWYPTIGSNGFCSLNVNFGQKEFKYKEANGMSVAGIISQELLNKIEKEIINVE
ncbi:concanavalin A-like lectin/glucanase domain-containing protein [Rhizophagus irregularis DAOM 181602=DAOM 197198]|nr:concanavalin A-like lectin/glucanase domain-containing protein [Rhizophagus irregularis DAOM 181602=DAOM 197198]